MNIFLLILKTIGVIAFTTLLATNLIGLFVRALYQRELINHLRNTDDVPIKEMIDDFAPKKRLSLMVLLFLMLILAALFLYYKYFGIYVAVALLLMMMFRLPDLISDIHGKKIDKKNYTLTFLAWIPMLLIVWNYFFKL
ncbi:hypothetical protein GCM10011418_15820 [Sphingobacterium alkalisoli]|nr:hypothetical protein GCM10011418_15820 [Sphingobacterium alkalisoli]